MIRIILCDEDAQDRVVMEKYCQCFFAEMRTAYELSIYSAEEVLVQDKEADVLILDAELKQITAIRIKDMLQKQGAGTRILFIGEHTEVMPQAFGKHVFDFLEKPLDYFVFYDKMLEICRDVDQQGWYVSMKTSEGDRLLCTRDIIYIEADGKYSKVYRKDAAEHCLIYEGFGVLKSRIEEYGFYVSSRGYLVNLAYVKGMEHDVILRDGSKVPLSRRMKAEFKEVFRQYRWRNRSRGF